jgi:hypothetical protein
VAELLSKELGNTRLSQAFTANLILNPMNLSRKSEICTALASLTDGERCESVRGAEEFPAVELAAMLCAKRSKSTDDLLVRGRLLQFACEQLVLCFLHRMS